jgi:hypothetical protein
MATAQQAGVRSRIDELQRQLDPQSARDEAIEELDHLFAGGRSPEPQPAGFLHGRLIATSISSPVDIAARRIAGMWMPWMGKSFSPESQSGVNILTASAARPMRLLWPAYVPEGETSDGIEAFRFRTRLAPGEIDPGLEVLKIDYDFDANPDFIIRRVLDELVQVDERFYLGKILYRWKGTFRRIGFFSLESA